ncbi:MAG: protein BatD [Sedimentisphaerales bacterium]|nr:protein BatD [Sedimentisphaerales bacterium]
MKNFIKYIFICSAFVFLLTGNTLAQIRVVAQVGTEGDIYVNSDFTLHIIIDGINKPGEVELNPLAEFNPGNPSMRDISQSSTIIVNGKVTQNATKRYVMSYTLNCSSAGQKQIPPLTVTVDGKQYQTNPVQVNILKPGTTDQLDLEVELSEKECYVGQPVVATIRFYYYGEIDNLSFNIPVFTSDDFYLEEPDIQSPQAQQARLSNGIIISLSRYKTTHNNRESNLLTFSKVLIPKRAGVINIEPTSISADVAVGRASSRDIFSDFFGSNVQYRRFMVSSKPAQLNVLNLPEQGKPDGFYGLVGKYSITSSASPTKVSVGDPITMNIKIGGNKYLKPIQWPSLEQIPDFEKNFKIPSEKASPVIEDSYKVFTQTIRANSDKVTEIPPIPLVYFDSEKGSYVTAKTEPIKLEVSPTKILTGSDLVGSDETPVNREVEAIKQGLSANYQDMDALQSHDFSPLAAVASPGYLVIWAGPLAVFLFSAFTKFYTHTTPEKQARKRRRAAAGRAISQLKNMSPVNSSESIETLASILKQYIGDRFDRMAGSLTSNDCYEVIANASGDVQAAQKYKEIAADFEASRYASAGTSVSSGRINEIIELILTIEKKSENNV